MAIDTIKSSAVLDGAIATADIADDAVTSAKIDSTSTGMTLADLTVDTNTLSVDATNNRVGIRTTSPTEALEVATDSKIKINSGGNSGNLMIQNGSGTTAFELQGGAANQNMRFLLASNTGSFFTFTTNTGEKVRISNDGLHLGGTGAANALDDYEEGTFTPVVKFGGGTTGITYTSGRQLGQYTKIGDSVFIYIHIQLTSKGSSTGAVQIHGLPFTVKSGGHHYIPAKVWIASMASLNETPTFRFMTGDTVMDCYQMSSSSYAVVTNSNCGNSTAFQISGHYFV